MKSELNNCLVKEKLYKELYKPNKEELKLEIEI